MRQQLVFLQATLQDVVLALATAEGSADARGLAGTAIVRWNYMEGEDEAYLAGCSTRISGGSARAAEPQCTFMQTQSPYPLS